MRTTVKNESSLTFRDAPTFNLCNMIPEQSFPLSWPLGRTRTSSWTRKKSPFKTTPGRARDDLMRELKLLGARNVVISSNVGTYRRGGQDIMYADQSAAKNDPGVAVYFNWNSTTYVIACDKWDSVWDNIQACMKTVNAIRGIERWGSGEMVKSAFSGFKELPSPPPTPSTTRKWWDVLGLSPNATAESVKYAYRSLLFKHHPDKGGTHEKVVELNNAWEQAKQQLGIN